MMGVVIHIAESKRYRYKGVIKFYCLILVFLFIGVFILTGLSQQTLVLKHYEIKSMLVPTQFDGYKIIHITDFHSGINSASAVEVIKMTTAQSPDIICLTGDIIDGTTPNFVPVNELIAGLSDIAPVYSVSGNNEHYTSSINDKMKQIYERHGVINMDGRTVTIFNGSEILLSGIGDTANARTLSDHSESLRRSKSAGSFHILLYHRANDFDIVVSSDYELVLSGHLHGGVVRLPFIGGILSPYDKLFPKYSVGLYEKSNSTLISNSGIGNNYIFPRVYNPPEVVLITLYKE